MDSIGDTDTRSLVLSSGVDRSKIKEEGSGSVRSNCFRRLEKNSFTFHFWHKSFILDDEKLAELSNDIFELKNVTF